MLFNSIDFALFLPVVFFLYWYVLQRDLVSQNFLIVCASYIFYGWWDWRFLGLIIVSTIVDYTIGQGLSNENIQSKRKSLLWLSILVNLGILSFFKYYNFFIENFVSAFSFIGMEIHHNSIDIILPVGISFYTFQTMSYTIDVYRRKLKPTDDFIAFAAYVSFFPQLVAGPIERATNLLPQFAKRRTFDYDNAVSGLRQILWGLIKKVVIADNCAEYANIIFNNSGDYSGSTLLVGAFFFAFQIYGDFSGYSDIAIGVARIFGINLMQNFAFPYFSRDIAEFWRRWHISLSTWFRDYLYIPLGGSRGHSFNKIRNTFIIFVVSGFWHGAQWTFIIWGALNAIYFLPLLLRNKNRVNLDVVAEHSLFPSIKELVGMIITFSFTILAWIFFRAESVTHAISILIEIFSKSFFTLPDFHFRHKAFFCIFLIMAFMFIEWYGRRDKFAIENILIPSSRILRYSFYYILIFTLIAYSGKPQEFIYFQF